MINQRLLMDYEHNNIYNNSSFITISETSSLEADENLLNLLSERGYFKENSSDWIFRIQNCQKDSISMTSKYSCGCELEFNAGCNSRVCPNCNERYRKKQIKKIGFAVSHMKSIKSLTLSPKNYSTEDFNSGFAMKETSKIWKAIQDHISSKTIYKIDSFVAVKEFKYNPKGSEIYSRKTKKVIGYHKEDNWNIHLHVLYDGSFIPQKLLSKVLFRITKGVSKYTFIKSLSSRYQEYGWVKSIKYISKYVGKFEVPNQDINRIADFYINTKNKRLINFSHSFNTPEFKKYCLKCPVCNSGYLSQIRGERELFVFIVGNMEKMSI